MWGPVVGHYKVKHSALDSQASTANIKFMTETEQTKKSKQKVLINQMNTTKFCDRLRKRLINESPYKAFKEKQKELELKQNELKLLQEQEKPIVLMNKIIKVMIFKIIQHLSH